MGETRSWGDRSPLLSFLRLDLQTHLTQEKKKGTGRFWRNARGVVWGRQPWWVRSVGALFCGTSVLLTLYMSMCRGTYLHKYDKYTHPSLGVPTHRPTHTTSQHLSLFLFHPTTWGKPGKQTTTTLLPEHGWPTDAVFKQKCALFCGQMMRTATLTYFSYKRHALAYLYHYPIYIYISKYAYPQVSWDVADTSDNLIYIHQYLL